MSNDISRLSNTTKKSTGSPNHMQRTPQVVSAKVDQTQNPPPLLPPGLEIQARGNSGMAAQRDIRETMSVAVDQSPTPAADDRTSVQSNGKQDVSMVAAPRPKRQGRDPAEITGETNSEHDNSPQSVVGGKPVHPDGGPAKPVRGYGGGGTRSSQGGSQSKSELAELRKKLGAFQQEKTALIRAKDNAQRKLDDAEKQNKDLKEQNRRQSEHLQTVNGHLRQAEDLYQQTLALLEVKTSELKGAQAFLSKGDSISGADLIGMVEALNAEILQVAAFIVDSLEGLMRAPKSAVKRNEITQLKHFVDLGAPITEALEYGLGRTGFDPLPVQVALQVCLVGTSWWIIRSWVPGLWRYDYIFSKLQADIRATEGQAISRRWGAITCSHLKQLWKMHEKDTMDFVFAEITRVLVLAGQGRSLAEEFLGKFRERLGIIVQSALRINEAMRVDVTSRDLQVIVFNPGVMYNAHDMDNAFSKGGNSGRKQDIVAGTTDIGILGTIGTNPIPDFLKKPKVVLASTLRPRKDSGRFSR